MINKLINKILSYHVDAEELKSKNPIIVIRNFLRRNHFIRSIHRWDKCKNNRGLGTFIIRQRKSKYKILERSLLYIKKAGFDILAIKYINPKDVDFRLKIIKNDNSFWNSDYPIACVAVWDSNPLSMNLKAKNQWPFWKIPNSQMGMYYYKIVPNMDNLRLLIKNPIRVNIDSSLPSLLREKYVHSADNFEEAWEYLRIIMPIKAEEIKEKYFRNAN